MTEPTPHAQEPPVPPYPYPHPAYPYGYPQYPPIPPPIPPDQRAAPSPYAAPSPWAPPAHAQYPYPPAQPGHQPQHGQPLSGDREPMPDNGLILAVIAVFASCACGGVFGLIPAFVALYQSNKVATLWSAGQRDLAREAAKSSKTWSLVSFGASVLGLCLTGLMVALLAGSGGEA